jgi:methylated-DNA-[protein]-cysteine S-methyltransferase
MNRPTRFATFETAAGLCGIAWTDRGIVRFRLPARDAAAAERALAGGLPDARSAPPDPTVAEVIARARAYFEGARTDFAAVDLDLEPPDDFAASVYAAVRGLGWGETTTYGALAHALGAPREAARDVGQAMARNPVPLLVPCHRVLAAGGKPGGFSAPGGSAAKLRMLALEGVDLAPPPPAQGALAL